MSPSPMRHPARRAGASLLRLQSDERLADLAADGHEAAFDAIVDRYRTPLTRYCAGIVGPSRAEDVVQQALINAHNALQRTDEVQHLRSWLYRIAHNAALNVLRAVRDDVPLDAASSAAAVAEDGPVEAFERSERFRETVEALRGLPERQRAALVLRELEGRSHEEIAETLGVTSGAARQHLMRARVALRGAVTAITPYPLVVRLAEMLTSPGAAGWTEAAVGAGAGATLAKLTAGVAATGALVGGAVGTERVVHHHRDNGQSAVRGSSSGGSATKPHRVETRTVSLPAAAVASSTGVPVSSSGGGASGSSGTGDHTGESKNKPKRDVRGLDHDAPNRPGPGGSGRNPGDDDFGGHGNTKDHGSRSGAVIDRGDRPGGSKDRRGGGRGKSKEHAKGEHDRAGNGRAKRAGDKRLSKGKGGGKGSSEPSGRERGDGSSISSPNGADGSPGSHHAQDSGHSQSGSSSTMPTPITEPTPSARPAPDPGSKPKGNERADKDSTSSKGSGSSKHADDD